MPQPVFHTQSPLVPSDIELGLSDRPLQPGRSYFVELSFSEPVVLYADGDYYDQGYAYYKDLKMECARLDTTKHSDRWTLALNIVTYARLGGAPLE